MPECVKKPSPDDWQRITDLLWLADPQNGSGDGERVAAVNELLAIFRAQVEEVRLGNRHAVNRLLEQRLKIWSLRIFADPDPLSAMAKFLGRQPEKPGKRAKNAERDFKIATAVVIKMSEGMSLDDASAAVAKDFKELNLSPEWIEKIYKANRQAAKADVAMSKIESIGKAMPSA